uniref:Uncharacterized protein n=1 Tax=Picea glauca TaxID=3330 RepID=A0A101LVL7_PICGL|nr:hypothetical protein ABT39_MTgene1995 [Picea glauca]QHR87482.1 hypothetical protein Q903MT_gene1493 [Picea sitchensis]
MKQMRQSILFTKLKPWILLIQVIMPLRMTQRQFLFLGMIQMFHLQQHQ